MNLPQLEQLRKQTEDVRARAREGGRGARPRGRALVQALATRPPNRLSHPPPPPYPLLSHTRAQEVNVFTSNFNDLKVAQSKFAGSIAALDDVGAAAGGASTARVHTSLGIHTHPPLRPSPTLVRAGEETLIPLTSSLYIPGRLVKDAEILVDVGAGFFVGRSAVDAKEILNRKVAYLKANTDSLMKVITVRQNNLNALREEIDERKAQQGIVQGSAGVQKLQS